MSQMPLPPNSVDDLLSDFFKAQVPQPWPGSPRTVEPASLVARRGAANNRSRVTLAASVALLLGMCWVFNNGPQPERGRVAPTKPGLLQDGSAKMPKEFEKPKEPMLN
jgi:hypothetical protein